MLYYVYGLDVVSLFKVAIFMRVDSSVPLVRSDQLKQLKMQQLYGYIELAKHDIDT